MQDQTFKIPPYKERGSNLDKYIDDMVKHE